MTPPIIGEANISLHLKQFLLVLSVSLGVATLSQTVNWFRKIPYTLLLVVVPGTGCGKTPSYPDGGREFI